MTIHAEAVSPMDGVAILRIGSTLRLLRPPYSLDQCPLVTEEALRDAVMKSGFVILRKEFNTWGEVVDWLNALVIESRRAVGNPIPSSFSTAEILDAAPRESITRFMDRIEQELIPSRLFTEADSFLFAVLSSSVAARFPEVGSTAIRLLKLSREAQRAASRAVAELPHRGVRFPSLERNHQLEQSEKLAEVIQSRGSVFSLVS